MIRDVKYQHNISKIMPKKHRDTGCEYHNSPYSLFIPDYYRVVYTQDVTAFFLAWPDSHFTDC